MPLLSIVFAGSPAVAIPTLEALLDAGHEISAVVTREDSPQGRRGILTPTPVAQAAEERSLRVIKANRLGDDIAGEVAELQPDLGVIVAYGGLVKEPLLSTPRLGWINLHFSVLPRWRGAAPVQRAIMAGDSTVGATVFQLVPELDAGDIFASSERPLGASETAGHALESLAKSEARLVVSVVDSLAAGTASATPQNGAVTLAPKLTLADGVIDFTAEAPVIFNTIRGVSPEPGASTTIGGMRLKILESHIAWDAAPLTPGRVELRGSTVLVGSASHPIALDRVLPAGKKAMNAADWWRGRPADAATEVDA